MTKICNLCKKFVLLFCLVVSFLLVWCHKTGGSWDETVIYVKWYEFEYKWNIKFQSVPLKIDDSDDIIALYQEEWEDLVYRDSLLVAEKYANWVWANVFIKDNLEILEKQWLNLSNISKKQIWLNKKWENINAVLLEYEITEWLISEIPLLYVSHLFIPDENSMVMLSYITESMSSRSSASNMFKNIN